MKTLDFELGRLYQELQDRLTTIATDTDSDNGTVRARLGALLSPDLVERKPAQHRYHVVGSKVKDWHGKAVTLHQLGLSYAEIGRKLGKHISTVHSFLTKSGKEKAKPLKGNAANDAKIRKLAGQGKTAREIAVAVGSKVDTLRRYAKDNSIEIKNRVRRFNPWLTMTPEERSAEMKRRREVALAKKAG